MIALILMQRGSGAQAGTGFGGGASATVFGSRGSSNFLSKATKWLAIVFFAITLFMAWHVTRTSQPGLVQQDLGLMSERSEEEKSERKALMGISYAGFCLKKKKR